MEELKICLVQTTLKWEDKKANLLSLEQQIRKIEPGNHIVVLPEMFSTGFSMRPAEFAESMEGETVQWMRARAAEKKMIICGSIIVKDKDAFYNRLIWMQPDGKYGHYDKRHLFAFAGEDQFYSSGDNRLIASVGGWKVNLMVCYDLRFPVWARQQFNDGNFEYDLLIYVANWPGRRSHAWRTLLQARAIENQCFVAGVNRIGDDGNGIAHSGNSMIVDPLGEIRQEAINAETLLSFCLKRSDLEEIRQKYPFWKDADEFQLLR
jgi:omega-amidase